MKQRLFLILIILTLLSCQTSKKSSDYETYTYLEVCFEDYYLNYDVKVSLILEKFELLLVEEGHLSDTTGKAYKTLLKSFEESDYFNPPLKMEDFNNTLLYKNPSNIINCATNVFSLDSTTIINTKFSKLAEEINEKMSKDEDISIHYFFDLYSRNLSDEEIRMPYVKQSILLLLYRWYFKSKYDRDIQIKAEDKVD